MWSVVVCTCMHNMNILSSPDLQVEMLCLELCCFVCVIQPSQQSCLEYIAQLVEHLPRTQNVAGSSLA